MNVFQHQFFYFIPVTIVEWSLQGTTINYFDRVAASLVKTMSSGGGFPGKRKAF